MGWRGSAVHWHRYRTAYLLLAGLAAPLVVSVHTVVSFDFTIGIIPGWHSTIFPPYFVAGKIYSGFAMVIDSVDPAPEHLRARKSHYHAPPRKHGQGPSGKLALVTYGYAMEVFFAWYYANNFEQFMIKNRMTGPYWHTYWLRSCAIA